VYHNLKLRIENSKFALAIVRVVRGHKGKILTTESAEGTEEE
jgi:hypothetical protein